MKRVSEVESKGEDRCRVCGTGGSWTSCFAHVLARLVWRVSTGKLAVFVSTSAFLWFSASVF